MAALAVWKLGAGPDARLPPSTPMLSWNHLGSVPADEPRHPVAVLTTRLDRPRDGGGHPGRQTEVSRGMTCSPKAANVAGAAKSVNQT